jgi:hypothetical protein
MDAEMAALAAERKAQRDAGFTADGVGPNEQQLRRDRAEAAVAPGKFIHIGNRTFHCHPDTVKETYTFREMLRTAIMARKKTPMKSALESIKNLDLPPDVRQQVIEVALKAETSEAGKMEPSDDELLRFFGSLDGFRMYVKAKCNSASPADPVDDVWIAEHVNEQTLEPLMNAFGELIKAGKVDPDAPKGSTPSPSSGGR